MLLKILIAATTGLLPLFLISANDITYTAFYNSPTYGNVTIGSMTYTTVNYEGLFNNGVPGMPSLPIDYIRFSVPYNATNFTVTAQPNTTTTFRLNNPAYPCQVPRMMSDTTPVVFTLPDSAVYHSHSDYPAQRAWIVNEGFLAGENHIVTVAVMPFAYSYSSSGLLKHNYKESRSVKLTLSYELSDTLTLCPIASNDENSKLDGRQLAQSMVVNPDRVPDFAPPITSYPIYSPYHDPSLNIGLTHFPYLIITTSDLIHSLRRLAALKRQKGYNVKIVTLDEIMNDPYAQYGDIVNINGTPTITFEDSAGVIREYLKLSKWFFGTKYLLLAGYNVPYRTQRKGTPLGSYDVPTDLYYSDLNGIWNRNSTIDLFPELFVGRLPAKKTNHIVNYTDKLLRYELNPGHGDYAYLRRSLYTEPVGLFDYSLKIGQNLNHIYPDSMIIRERPYENYPTGRDLINLINENRFGFWCALNHGSPSCIITYGVNFWNELYSNSYFFLHAVDTVKILPFTGHDTEINNGLNRIEDSGYEMILYSTSCQTIPFDVKPKYSALPMNFGESFIMGRNYGGPAYMGNTNDGVNPSSRNLCSVFAKDLVEKSHKIGVAEALSKFDNNDELFGDYLAMTHNLLGDPEFEVWTGTPQLFTNINITRTDNSISINGIDTDSTIVAYCSNDGQIGMDTISTSSVVLNSVSPNSTVMLYKHNHIPYIAPLDLQNITFNNNQYVIANDVNAGSAIDNNRSNGSVIVPDGIEYEIESSGKVTLLDGFKVEKGAFFAVYPSCF